MPRLAVSAVLLAAGSSRRFGTGNKLLAEVDGVALALATARMLAASHAAELIVVTGHERDRIEALLSGVRCRFVYNPHHRDGIGGSVAAGIAAVAADSAGALIVQADMPSLPTSLIDHLIGRFDETGADRIVYPVGPDGRQRNPVLWPRRLFPLLTALTGDTGAKDLITARAGEVEPVRVEDATVFADLDTPEEFARFRRTLGPEGA